MAVPLTKEMSPRETLVRNFAGSLRMPVMVTSAQLPGSLDTQVVEVGKTLLESWSSENQTRSSSWSRTGVDSPVEPIKTIPAQEDPQDVDLTVWLTTQQQLRRLPTGFVEQMNWRHLHEQTGATRASGITVPADLTHIVACVERARSLVLDGPADPEGDAETYLMATLQRASRFLLRAAVAFWRSRNTRPPAPLISGGPDGSIDLVWRGDKRTLYINVPEEPENVVTFFGTDQENSHLKLRGEEDPKGTSGWLLSWLLG